MEENKNLPEENLPEENLPEENLPEENLSEENLAEQNQPEQNLESAKDEKIALLEKAVIDLNDKVLRAMAETENVRRRSREEMEKIGKYAISGFAGDLVVVVENFFLATDNSPQAEIEKSPTFKNFFEAMNMTKKEMMKVLEKNQIKRLSPLNEKFDHNFHEAIAQIESDAEKGTVVQVIQAGYSISDRLIRPALVGVAKPKA